MRKTRESWCSGCYAPTSHNIFAWHVIGTKDKVLGCRKCGKLRSLEQAHLEKGVAIARDRDDTTETMVEDGRLFKEENVDTT